MHIAYELATAQAAVACGCILLYFTRIILPKGPQWVRSFAKEEPSPDRPAKSWTFWTILLLVLSILGCVFSSVKAVFTANEFPRLLEVIPWAAAAFITLADRPKRTPKTLLVIYTTTLVCNLAALVSVYNAVQTVHALRFVSPGIALAALCVILAMPMRDPVLEIAGIAGPDDPPSYRLRSPEDNLTLWQFMTISWLSPLINRGYKHQLNDEDVWLLPYDFQHKRLHSLFRDLKGSIITRLCLANGLDLFIITFLGCLESIANLSAPILLQRLLVSIESGFDHRNESILWALAILVVRLAAAQASVFSLWFCRRAYERSRGEMITTIYAKTLTRKSYGQRVDEEALNVENGRENGVSGDDYEVDLSEEIVDENLPLLGGKVQKRKSRLSRFLDSLRTFFSKAQSKSKTPTQQPATMGKILNLMKSDVYEVAQRFWEFANLITKPLQLVLSLILVWQFLGWSCLPGVAWVIFVQFINSGAIHRLLVNEKLRRTASDIRIHATSQFIEAIRPLRWYDWQSKWLKSIMGARSEELNLRIVTGLWSIAISGTNLSATVLFPVLSFFAYTYIAKQPLSIDVIFPALQLFTMLETSLKEIPNLITVVLNAYVAIGRIEAFMAEPDKDEDDSYHLERAIEFRDTTFKWPTNNRTVLEKLNLRFDTGMSIICGKVGAGKTALLQAILGDLDKVQGECDIPSKMVGYCAQSPWLQNMSIRDNILFNFPYDPVRYKKVVDTCALTVDLSNFTHGDLSNIGENGIGLSGGQKARVALARAVYSESPVLLLDDPLAALDHGTAESIVQKLFQGPLVQGRTIVLVTHRVNLCAHLADQIVEITNGKARVLEADEIAQEIDILTNEQQAVQAAHQEEDYAAMEEEAGSAVPDKFMTDENRASGGVVARIYWIYIKAGKLKWWAVVVVLFSIFRLLRVFSSWFLKAWGEAYPSVEALMVQVFKVPGFYDFLPNPADNVAPWIIFHAVLSIVMALFYVLTQCALLLILYVAAKNLFGRVLYRVSSATFRFYDTTPVGRLMNRLTSDIGMLDGGMIAPLQDVTFWSLNWIISMAVIAFTTPAFFVFALAMTLLFVYIFMHFLPTSQSLRRLEMVSLSPLMSNFGILLDGLATIRAFNAQWHFQNRNIVITDAFQKMDHFYWSLQAWLMYRFDVISGVSTFGLTILALYQGLSPGLTAFVLITASQFVDATHGLCKAYGQLQMDFVSVERVVELLDLEEEPVGDIEPPASWPSYNDDITFDHVTLKYAPHLEPSLKEISLKIPAGATCAVLGRTGSGKSTLALALLATMRPEQGGSISVGSMDISKVNVHAWRQRISFVAQDPVLFPGTLRDNLDPLSQHSDAECEAALRRTLGPGWSLSSRVDDGGKNMSQGQRQLVGIGRAVLRRSPVIILDEATASIDRETALAIQDVLRDELARSTVITIAHRLEAVRDADYFVRLDSGRVVESGPTGSASGGGGTAARS
ncbi:ABC transporter [Xylariaceae sp. FL0255]|nr:ABC transporter [Xylariaceae sp. FL0255]